MDSSNNNLVTIERLDTFAEIIDIIKANKDVNSVEGNIAVFNNDGNPVDSNYSFLNIPILDANGKIPASQLNIVEGYLDSGVFYKVENIAVDYVEIGGLKWATKNVGANSVTDYGLYFQWGDTQGYTAAQVGSGSGQKYFGWADYKYGNGTSSPGDTGMTKYNSTDGKTVLDLSDDAARANWGGNWRMPTTAEFQALSAATTTAWTADYEGSDVKGLVLTSKADSSKVLFFPAAGRCSDGRVTSVGVNGSYWSSSVRSSGVQYAYYLSFFSSHANWQLNNNRYGGFAVRGVWDGQGTPVISLTVQVTPESNTLYIDTTTNKIYRYNGSSYVEVSYQSLENYVTLNTTQTISGGKTFTAMPYLNNSANNYPFIGYKSGDVWWGTIGFSGADTPSFYSPTDTTWYRFLTLRNYDSYAVTLDTKQTITGSKTFKGILNIGNNGGSVEGGELRLYASDQGTTFSGTTLDNYIGKFRIFGIPSADGTTRTGTGTPLVIDPYDKTITGGYNITGTLNGTVCGNVNNAEFIEFNGVGSSEGHGGYIDFHYNGSTADYTSRIIEQSSGTIEVKGNLAVTGSISTNGQTLGTAATKNSTTTISSGSNDLITSGAVYAAIGDIESILATI